MFKFNFPDPSSKDSDDNICQKECTAGGNATASDVIEAPAEQILYTRDAEKKFDDQICHTFTCEDETALHYVDSQQVEERLCTENPQSAISCAVSSQSDLLPGVYEGGLKVWECSLDLANHLSGLQIPFRGLNVLELGCGAGLPGLYALAHEARVTFQDYNREVITDYTIPNCLLNVSPEVVDTNCQFYSGDWGSLFPLLLDKDRFDMVLTSETIYNPLNYGKLHDILENLTTENATIYVAAKVYYFGVGGSIEDFLEIVNLQNVFSVESTVTHQKDVQREILCLRKKN